MEIKDTINYEYFHETGDKVQQYSYYPDSYDWNLVTQKFGDLANFVTCQALYREKIEELLKKLIDFDEIRNLLNSQQINIPKVEDQDYNFYHKYSTLGLDHVFLRNNFHVENLTEQELEILTKGDLTPEFINSTLAKVIYEDGEKTFCGIPNDETIVQSKSLIFEFAFDQKKCEDFDEFLKIEEIRDNVFSILERDVKKIGLPISCLTYRAIPDIYYLKEDTDVVQK